MFRMVNMSIHFQSHWCIHQEQVKKIQLHNTHIQDTFDTIKFMLSYLSNLQIISIFSLERF